MRLVVIDVLDETIEKQIEMFKYVLENTVVSSYQVPRLVPLLLP